MTDRRVEIEKGSDGQWYWRRVAISNGQTVAVGGEGYTERNDAIRAARTENPGLPVTFTDEG